jgi:hypothetical protein
VTALPPGWVPAFSPPGRLRFFLLGMLPPSTAWRSRSGAGRFGLAEGQGGTLFATYNAGAFVAVAAGIAGVPAFPCALRWPP